VAKTAYALFYLMLYFTLAEKKDSHSKKIVIFKKQPSLANYNIIMQ